MNGSSMKMELDGNINNKENIGEISVKDQKKSNKKFQILCKFIQSMIIKKQNN